MKKSSLFILALSASTILGACSFQKDPNKPAKVVETPKEVKVGMTKEEIQEHLSRPEAGTLPDKILFALKIQDPALLLKVVWDAESYEIDDYGSDGITALDLALKHDLDEIAVLLLEKGASPYRMRQGSTTRLVDAHASKISESPTISALIKVSGKKLYEDGFDTAKSSIAQLQSFVLRTGFSVTSSEFGTPIIEALAKSIEKERSFIVPSVKSEKNRNRYRNRVVECGIGIQEFLDLVIRLDGDAKIPWRDFFNGAIKAKSVELVSYVGTKIELASSDYLQILTAVEGDGYESIMNVQYVLGDSKITDRHVEESLLRYIEKAGTADLIELIYDKYDSKEIYEKFPEAYRSLYEKVGTLQVAEEVATEGSSEGEGELPGGKIAAPRNLFELSLQGKEFESRCD